MASSAAHSKANEIQRQEIQSAIAKAVELRAVHAALVQGSGSSPSAMRLLAGASPSVSRFSNYLPSAAADAYPIFTHSYEEDPLPGYSFIHPDTSHSLRALGSGHRTLFFSYLLLVNIMTTLNLEGCFTNLNLFFYWRLRLRDPYITTLNVCQAYTLKLIRDPSYHATARLFLLKEMLDSNKSAAELVKLNPTSDYAPGLEDTVILTMKGIAASMQNTG